VVASAARLRSAAAQTTNGLARLWHRGSRADHETGNPHAFAGLRPSSRLFRALDQGRDLKVAQGAGKLCQSNPDYWLKALPDRITADSIVNRITGTARKINLGDTDMRKRINQTTRAQPDYWE
jgi:hypothetical protein